MSTDNTDVKYAMKAFAEASLAFQGASWVNDSSFQQSEETNTAAHTLQHKHGTITEADVEEMIALEEAKHKMSGISAAEIAALRDDMRSYIGAAKSQKGEMKAKLATAFQAMSESTNHGESFPEKMAAYDARMEDLYKKLKEQGYIEEETEKKRKELIAARDAFPANSKEWLERNKILLEFNRETLSDVKEKAESKNDKTAAQDAQTGLDVTNEAIEMQERMEYNVAITEKTTQPALNLEKKFEPEFSNMQTSSVTTITEKDNIANAVSTLDPKALDSLKQLAFDEIASETTSTGQPAKETIPGAVAILDTKALDGLKQLVLEEMPLELGTVTATQGTTTKLDATALESLKKLSELQEDSALASLSDSVSAPMVPNIASEGKSRA